MIHIYLPLTGAVTGKKNVIGTGKVFKKDERFLKARGYPYILRLMEVMKVKNLFKRDSISFWLWESKKNYSLVKPG